VCRAGGDARSVEGHVKAEDKLLLLVVGVVALVIDPRVQMLNDGHEGIQLIDYIRARRSLRRDWRLALIRSVSSVMVSVSA